MVRQWAIDGLGIALKSAIDISDDIDSKRLVSILNTYSSYFQRGNSRHRADLYVVYPTRQIVPERVRTCIDMLEQHFKTLTDTV